LVVALDIGTSSVRALLFDAHGEQVPGVEVHLPYPARVAPDGTYEVDAGKLFGLVATAVDNLLRECGPRRRRRIAGVGISTFWHGLVAADGRGQALTPVYLWGDTRCRTQADRLKSKLDAGAIHQRTGCIVHTTYWPAKLAWLRETRPEVFNRPEIHWLSFWDLVHQRLFGGPLTSLSMASGTGLLDLDGGWDGELLEELGIRQESLPEIGVAGTGLLHEYAVRWPELAAVPWVCAAGDGALANFGSGCVKRTQRALTVGTSAALRVLYAGRPGRVPDGLWCYRLDGRRVVMGGAMSNGGNLYAWMTKNLAVSGDGLEFRLRRMKPAGHGLTFLPLLAGERSLGFATHASGSLAGLTQATTADDITRAGLEAIGIEIARVNTRLDEAVPPAARIVANGAGLLSSPAWMQIMADTIGRPVAESKAREASSRGAALFALEYLGIVDGDRLPAEVGRVYRCNRNAHQAFTAATRKQEILYKLLITDAALDATMKSPTATGEDR